MLPRSLRAFVLSAGAALALAGCQENLAGGAACPALCPDTLTIKDTVLFAAQALDTDLTVPGSPPLGTELALLVANYEQGGDRLVTGVVLRFDSLQRAIVDTTGKPPRPLTRIDTAGVYLNIIAPEAGYDSTLVRDSVVTFLVYDVDADAPDLDTAVVRERFSSPPIASRVVARDSLTGTIAIPLDSGFVASHVRSGQRIRLGIRVQSDNGAQVRIGSTEGGNPSTIRYTAHADTSRISTALNVNTRSTSGPPISSMADHMLLLEGAPPAPSDILAAGGVPPSRVFIRFNLPAALIDSTTTVVRANLELHQQGNALYQSTDSISLVTRLVRATHAVSDVGQAAVLTVDPGALGPGFAVPPLVVNPAVTRVDTIPLANVFLLWKREGRGSTQRAIVLQSSGQAIDPRRFYLYSSAAATDSLRPRIRITYIPRSGFGLP